jgi:hypothetical protein
MSYGFHLFRVPAGKDPTQVYKEQLEEQEARAMRRQEGLLAPEPVNPDEQNTQRQLASALVSRYPTLKIFEPDAVKLAHKRHIDLDEARRRFNYLQLTEEEFGIQITLFHDTAAITIPFWRLDRERAEQTLRAAWDCLRTLELDGGFSTYDTQQGRFLDLSSDFETVLNGYAGMSRTVDKTLRKPRWEFW